MSDATPPGGSPVSDEQPIDNSLALDIATEMKDSYLTYAMSVIVSRALPDVRDGLKPSQRRVLVAMNDMNLGPTATTSKCAGIVGRTMERYHPHGDKSIYDALVHLAQDWSMRYPLIHPQGNFGSIAGLPAAAMRYTEARLTPVAAEMLDHLDHDTVDFIDNYDGKYREPLVLPARFPNLLVNGSDGIAVGMATDIPPHNLREVCDGLIRLIDDPHVTIPQLMEHIPGPDFPTGGLICGRQGIMDGYATGRGKITLRARAEIVEEGRERTIIIRETPFQVTRNRLAAAIAELADPKNERIKGIRDVRDESSARKGEPVRIVVYLKQGRDIDPNLILNQLYQFSPLEKTVSIIMLALVDGQPQVLNLKAMLEQFLRHRKEVVRRRTEFLLREAKKRSHIIEGQLIAVSSLDEVIRVCREADSREAAKDHLQRMSVSAGLMERALGASHFEALAREIGQLPEYHLTEAQAEAVVRMQLGQLARLQRDEVMREYVELRGKVRSHEDLLGSEQAILGVIKEELTHLRDKHGDDRRTDFTGEAAALTNLDLIQEEEQVVTLSHHGYIKRLPINTYRAQNRGGRGVSGGTTKDEDFIEHFFVASTHAYLFCFTNRGQLYWLRVVDIPEGTRTSGGRHINQVLQLKPEERISSVIPVRNLNRKHELDAEQVEQLGLHLLMATRAGVIKKTSLAMYCRPKSGGIIGINLDDVDALIGVVMVRPGDEVLLCTKKGMAIRFDEADARPMGRNTHGVKGIKLTSGDEVVGVVVSDPDGMLLSVCENGFGKCTPFGPNTAGDVADEEEPEVAPEPVEAVAEVNGEGESSEPRSAMYYRKQRRGGKGIRDIRTSERNGPVVGVVPVRGDDDVMLITTGGMVTRMHVNSIRVSGRNTQGVRLVSPKEGDTVSSVVRLAPEEAEPSAPEAIDAPTVG